MLGSRFDLAQAVRKIAQRGVEAEAAREDEGRASQDAMLGDYCAELERQMAEMARSLHADSPRNSVRCPICDSRMQLSAGRILSEYAALGVEQHDLECDTCGLTTERTFHGAIGYAPATR